MRSFFLTALTVICLLLIAPALVWLGTGSFKRAVMAGRTYLLILGCIVAAGFVSGVAMWATS